MNTLVSLFPVLDQKLMALLRSLYTTEWYKPTLAPLWSVKDIASHLLDGNLRMISLSRDAHINKPDREINSYDSLVGYLNQLNADWVKATRRLSPQVLIEWLDITGKQYIQQLASLDPDANAVFPVSWAGEKTSTNRFHIAREYTEKWHHQQQIREATGRQGILTKELYYPFIETILRGLPYTYRNTKAAEGTIIQITIDSEIGGNWYLKFENNKWQLLDKNDLPIEASLIIPPGIAWKLFTKGISPSLAKDSCRLSGNTELAKVALGLIAVMA